jgi:dephospho-CoA kinase
MGIPVSKENQQWLATIGRDKFGQDFLFSALLEKIKSSNNSMIVVNGVRYTDEAEGLRQHGAAIWFIDAPARSRWTRIQTRGEKLDDESSWEDFLKREEAATEQQIGLVKDLADEIIDNSGSLEELKQKICLLF